MVAERNALLTTLTNTVTAMAAENAPQGLPEVENPALARNLEWGRLMGFQVNDLPINIQARVKLAVGTVICDAMEGIWRPT